MLLSIWETDFGLPYYFMVITLSAGNFCEKGYNRKGYCDPNTNSSHQRFYLTLDLFTSTVTL